MQLDIPNLGDLLKAGAAGDKEAFKSVLQEISKQAKEDNNLALSDLIEATWEKGPVRVEDKTSEAGKAAAFQKELSDISEIPIGLSWVKTNVTMDHVILRDHVRRVIKEFIEEQEHNEVYLENGLDPRNKCMLMGPPGNGKTALAKAIANRIGCPLYFVRYDELISQKPGETSKRLHTLFQFVKTHRCILFFDEMDAIGKERGDDNEAGEMKRVVSTLLIQLDDVPPHVIVLGATNHAGMLDKAVWRRFHIRVALPEPSDEEFAQYLKMAFEKYDKSPKIDLEILALSLEAENFAETEVFVEDCIRTWVRRGKAISIDEAIDEAIDAWPRTRVKIPRS